MQIHPIPAGPLRPVQAVPLGMHSPCHRSSHGIGAAPHSHGSYVPAVKVDWHNSEKEQQVEWARRQYSTSALHQAADRSPSHQASSRAPEGSIEHLKASFKASCSQEHKLAMAGATRTPESQTAMAGANRSPELQPSMACANQRPDPQGTNCNPGGAGGNRSHRSSVHKMPTAGPHMLPWLLQRLGTAIDVRGKRTDSPCSNADIKELETLKDFAVEAAVKGDGTDQSVQVVRGLKELFLKVDHWLDGYTSHLSVAVARQRLWFGTHLQHAIWALWASTASVARQPLPDATLKKPDPAPIYAVDEYVEYWSSTHKEWTTTKVKRVYAGGHAFDLANRNNAAVERIYPTTEEKVKIEKLWQVQDSLMRVSSGTQREDEKREAAKVREEPPSFSAQCQPYPVSPQLQPALPQTAHNGSPAQNQQLVQVWSSQCLTSRPQGHVSSMQNVHGVVDAPHGRVSSMQNLCTAAGCSDGGSKGTEKKEHARSVRSSGGSDPAGRIKKYDGAGVRSDRGRLPLSYDHGSERSLHNAGRSSTGSGSGCSGWDTSHGSMSVTGRSSSGSGSRRAARTAVQSGKKSSRGSSSPPAPLPGPLNVATMPQRSRRSSDGTDKSIHKSSQTGCATADGKESPLSEMRRIHKRMEDFLWQCGVDPHAPTVQTSPRQSQDSDSARALTSPTKPMNPTAAVAAAAEAAATAAAAAAKISACFYTPTGPRPVPSTPEIPTPCFERRNPSSRDLDAIDAQIKAMIGKAGTCDEPKETRHSRCMASSGGA